MQVYARLNFMIPEYFAVVGAIVASLGGLYYLYETITGKSKPNRVTWMLWALFPMITFIAQKVQGVEGVTWVTFASGFTPLLIVVASFANKQAYWKTTKSDYYVLVAALAGIALWAITNTPNIAIMFAIIADAIAALPTVIKCFRHPETESWRAYALSTVGFTIGVLSISEWKFENYSFVIYLDAVNFIMAILSSRSNKAKSLHTEVE